MNTTQQNTFNRNPANLKTVSRANGWLFFTGKFCRDVPDQSNSAEKTKEARLACTNFIYEWRLQMHRIYGGETGFNLYTRRSFGRGVANSRVARTVVGDRGRNVTQITAISGMSHHEINLIKPLQKFFPVFMSILNVRLKDNQPLFCSITRHVTEECRRQFLTQRSHTGLHF